MWIEGAKTHFDGKVIVGKDPMEIWGHSSFLEKITENHILIKRLLVHGDKKGHILFFRSNFNF
jgi:hypothetical protein